MTEIDNKFELQSVANLEEAAGIMHRLLEIARPESVFSEPVTNGEYTVVTASEVTAGAGFGYGGGSGSDSEAGEKGPGQEISSGSPSSYGGGGGGGGTALARPVAVIAIGPNGVRVEPVIDPTKIAIAFLTTMAAIVATLSQMRRKH